MRKTTLACLILCLTLGFLFAQDKEIRDLKEQILQIQNKGNLGFSDFSLCSKIFGFASYVPLTEPVIAKDGTLLLYYEPSNVYTSKRGELYEIWYTQDMVLLDADGKVINEWKDILSFKYAANKPVMDLFAENSLELTGLPPGNYRFKAIVKDKLSEKTAEKTISFDIK